MSIQCRSNGEPGTIFDRLGSFKSVEVGPGKSRVDQNAITLAMMVEPALAGLQDAAVAARVVRRGVDPDGQ